MRGLSEGSAELWGGPRDFPRFFGGSDPMLVTLGNCWSLGLRQERPSQQNAALKERVHAFSANLMHNCRTWMLSMLYLWWVR